MFSIQSLLTSPDSLLLKKSDCEEKIFQPKLSNFQLSGQERFEHLLKSLQQVQSLANFGHLAQHLKDLRLQSTNCLPNYHQNLEFSKKELDCDNDDLKDDVEIEIDNDSDREDKNCAIDLLNSNKRRRTSFSSIQLLQLEREFLSKKYLSLNERAELAKSLKLSQEQIKVWFQNRRAKWKRSKGYRTQGGAGQSEHTSSSSAPSSGYNSSLQSSAGHKIHVPIPVHVDRVKLRSQQQQLDKRSVILFHFL